MFETENDSSCMVGNMEKNNSLVFFNKLHHFIGHDVIGHPDVNKISRFDKQGTEVCFALPSTDKKLRPLRCALISYFCVMLRISTVGNTLKDIR